MRIFKWIHLILLTIFPGFASEYLLSNDPRITKVAFGVSIIAFTRLVNHFDDKPGTINTMVSIYLNGKDDLKNTEIIKINEIIKMVEKIINKFGKSEFEKLSLKNKLIIE